jgi:hypothetical protein
VAAEHAWNVKSARERRGDTSGDPAPTLLRRNIGVRVERKEHRAACRSHSRAPKPHSRRSRKAVEPATALWPDSRRSRKANELPKTVVTRTREATWSRAERSHHLTRHKISCREPSVHATQHTATTADTGSVNRRLARGQLHRLVRWSRSRGARVERRLCARETRPHQRRRNANSAEAKHRSARGAKRKHDGASLPHPRDAAGRPPEPSSDEPARAQRPDSRRSRKTHELPKTVAAGQ